MDYLNHILGLSTIEVVLVLVLSSLAWIRVGFTVQGEVRFHLLKQTLFFK